MGQQGVWRPHLALPAALLPQVEGNAVCLLFGAEQVDVECDEELSGPCDSGAPAGDEVAGAKVRCPLGLLELWGDTPRGTPAGLGQEEEGTPTPAGPPQAHPTHRGNRAPSQGGLHTPQPGWPAGSGDWLSAPPRRRGTLQAEPGGQASAGGWPTAPFPRRSRQATALAQPGATPPSARTSWVGAFLCGLEEGCGWPLLGRHGPGLLLHPPSDKASPTPAARPTRAPEKPSPRLQRVRGGCGWMISCFFIKCIFIVQ